MCDYSLHAVASRPAKVGETLVSTRFISGGTVGFASSTELSVAVCLLPGTELAFEKNVRYHGDWFRSHTVNFNVLRNLAKSTPRYRISIMMRFHSPMAARSWSTH